MCTKAAVHVMMILLPALTSVSCSSRDEDTPDTDAGVRRLELKVDVRDFADSENYGQNAQESFLIPVSYAATVPALTVMPAAAA